MALNEYLTLFLPAVEQELHRVVDSAFLPECEDLHTMLAYHLGFPVGGLKATSQGKRIRPIILLLCAAAMDHPWSSALPAAVAVELIHNFSLIHDDIEDSSPLRRGRPTVWSRWGVAQAINAGDAMFSLAQTAILDLESTTSPTVALAACQILNKACINLTEGQYLDLAYESKQNLTIDAYWPMITGKTARLLSACTAIGALAGAASLPVISEFEEFGRNLGLAFQIQDDYLGIWGDASLTGKSTQSDLASRKKTLPVLYGLAQNGDFARRWKDGPIQAEEVSEAAGLLARDGGKDYAQQTADRLTQLALQALDRAAPHETNASLALTELVQLLLLRQS